MIEGARPVIEAIRAGRRRVFEIRLPSTQRSAAQSELARLARERGLPTREADGRSVVAHAEPYPETSFESLLTGPAPRWLVALDGVTDVGNLGSIARSAEAAGIGGLVLEYRRAPPLGPGALRASAGAIEHLRVGRTPNLRRALELARSEGLSVGVAESGGASIEELGNRLRGELVLVLGSEENGTRNSIRKMADFELGIPLAGRVGSLGVSAAAAYLLLRIAEIRRAGESEG